MPTPPRLSPFGEYCSRQIERWGLRFNDRGLRPKYVPYFNSGERIRVDVSGEIVTGTVSATTGYSPQFMLMRNSRSVGSRRLLSESDEILAVQRNGKYVPV